MRVYLHLLRRHLMQYPGRAAMGLLVLTIAAMLMLALAGAGAALRFRVGGYLAQLFPEERLTLEAAQITLGPVAMEGHAINDATVAHVKARAEVQQVWPVEPVRFPIRIEGTLFGQTFTSDAVVYGVPRELIADALGPSETWIAKRDDFTSTGALPIVVSRYFLDIYNMGLARTSGLPLLSASAVVGRHAKLVLGESATGLGTKSTTPTLVNCRIAGMTTQPSLLGLALPAGVVRRFNELYAPTPEATYVRLVVLLQKGADREEFLRWAGGESLRLAGGDVTATQLKLGVKFAGWGLMGLAIAVFGMGMMTFYLLFAMTFHARRLDLIRLRAMGLSPWGAVALALGEVAAVAICAVLAAGGAIALASEWASRVLEATIKQYDWLPPGLFAPAPGWLALASIGILILTLLPALPMLRWVVKVEPAAVIRDM